MKRYEEIYVIQYYNEANPFDYRFHTHTPQFALRLKKSAQNYNLLNG